MSGLSKNDLNPQQRQAVTSIYDGHVIVIAGAGSGKTRVLTYAAAYLIKVKGVDPDNILLLTFTRRAANEMIVRAGQLAGGPQVQGGTFHSFAVKTLRKYAKAVELKSSFTIIDTSEASSIISGLRKDLLAKLGRRFKNPYPRAGAMTTMISKSVNLSMPLEDIVVAQYKDFIPVLEHIEAIRMQYRAYKLKHQYVDFDDLLVYLAYLLHEKPEICEALRKQFRYILVDEYQDTNLIQAAITEKLAGDGNHVMAVGDDAQSIYGFRGAAHTNLFTLTDNLQGAQVVKLEQNYRSVQPILDVVNQIQGQMGKQFRKTLFTEREGGKKPQVIKTSSQLDEAQVVLREIKVLMGFGIKLSEIAVLYRVNRNAVHLEVELNRDRIPYNKYGGLRFTEAKHVKDILAYLRVAANPTDELAGKRALMLCEGVGTTISERVWQAAPGGDLYERVATYQDAQGGRNKSLLELGKTVHSINPDGNPELQVKKAIDHYLSIPKVERDTTQEDQEDFKVLLSIAETYETAHDLLQDLAIDPPHQERKQQEWEDRLTLSTIHSAKGLEWRVVFLIQSQDGMIPHANPWSEPDYEEERRILYVALTRAEDKLYVSWNTRGSSIKRGDFVLKASRYLRKVPRDLFQKQRLG
jgi:DNA helicase-2/ATP-dependent DNA helicase PcrA